MTPVSAARAYFLVGPTAVGKTAVAHWIAERDGVDILSADSMLVYRGMDIGTAKPTPRERAAVRYHGIDLASPGETFSVWAYRAYSLRVLETLQASGGRLLVAGGTGLYVKSLIEGLAPVPGAEPERRARWEALAAREGPEPLRRELQRRNPAVYEGLRDKENVRRLIRALEWTRQGQATVPDTWKIRRQDAPMPALYLPPERLKSRIELRVQAMYRQGLLEEVEALSVADDAFSSTAGKAIGYREAMEVLDGRCTVEEAQQRTMKRTWQLARRQLTWFRHQADVRWIEIGTDATVASLAACVLRHWREYGPTRLAG